MNKSTLRAEVEATGSCFFHRSSMRFFGDTMRNYGCGRNPIEITDSRGETRTVYALWRIHPVKHGLCFTTYFDAKTFARVFVAETKTSS
jgi:hypothetical protein